MTKFALLALVILVAGALFIPAVSADEILYDEDLVQYIDTSFTDTKSSFGDAGAGISNALYFDHIERYPALSYVIITVAGNEFTDLDLGRTEFTYQYKGINKPGVVYKSQTTTPLGSITSTRLTLFLNEWDIGTDSGKQYITLPIRNYATALKGLQGTSDVYWGQASSNFGPPGSFSYTVSSAIPWKNHIKIIEESQPHGYNINLERTILGDMYTSTINCSLDDTVIFSNSEHGAGFNIWYPYGDIDKVTVINPQGLEYIYNLFGAEPEEPEDTPIRIGTVTMTDHNGTSITGFEVTAINVYTDEEYTVTTETDVAVMTLPMDRTITLRNPQTGEYEETTVGYYRIFGQSPGYKMLLEDGIQVAVMPERYSSYQLCDILVTSESGYLSGQHKFQIRSRSDNSILQTGTISAKSATTGQWYNTTVSGGIATLVLPYDTSNTISEYAGNYYVYATSPGYVDSDYGTQIVVMPHTASEINTVLLTPIGGIPPAGNVTLRIQVFSETGPGVNNAEIFIAGVLGEGSSVWDTYTASSTGYLSVSVPGNSTYDIVASGAGYYDSARRVEVFTQDPALIEIKLYLSGAPTLEPTTQPTGWPTAWPTPTPTATTTPGGSFIDQSAQAVATFMGVSFDVGKTALGLFITSTVGYTTARKLRGGAPEFGIGMLAGAVLCVAFGLLPIQMFVVLFIGVGALLGYRYMGGGGGR